MKKLCYFMLSLLLGAAAIAQNPNGGQASEDQYIKLSYIGNMTCRIENKSSCDVVMHISIQNKGPLDAQDVTVDEYGHYDFPIELGDKVKVRPTNNCAGYDGNMGSVELDITPSLLPLKPGSLDVQYDGDHTLVVSFEVYNSSALNYYHIRLSRDSKIFTPVTVILTDPVQPNRRYSFKINLNKVAY